jgi:hypothetical protein
MDEAHKALREGTGYFEIGPGGTVESVPGKGIAHAVAVFERVRAQALEEIAQSLDEAPQPEAKQQAAEIRSRIAKLPTS